MRKHCRHIFNFCRSRSEYLTQAQFYMFIETEVPSVYKDLSVENLRRFTDLCCQQVEQYQEGILLKRPSKAGRHNRWKRPKYTMYETKHAVDPLVNKAYRDKAFYQERFPNLNHLFPNYMRALRDNVTQQITNSIDNQGSSSNRRKISSNISDTQQCSLSSATINDQNRININEKNNSNDSECNQTPSYLLHKDNKTESKCLENTDDINVEDNDIIDIDGSENEIKERSDKEASLVPNVDVDTCVDDDTNVQSYSSNQAEPSKMTPEELRAYMHRSTTNFGEVLFSGKFDPRTLKKVIDNRKAEKSMNKIYRNEDSTTQVVQKKMKYNKETYDMVSTSTATSQNQDYFSNVTSNYRNHQYNYEKFKQVSLQNTFNELYHKYKKADVRKVFSPQQIESSIQHVVSKVKEFTVLAYAEDQQLRVEDFAGDCE